LRGAYIPTKGVGTYAPPAGKKGVRYRYFRRLVKKSLVPYAICVIIYALCVGMRQRWIASFRVSGKVCWRPL